MLTNLVVLLKPLPTVCLSLSYRPRKSDLTVLARLDIPPLFQFSGIEIDISQLILSKKQLFTFCYYSRCSQCL